MQEDGPGLCEALPPQHRLPSARSLGMPPVRHTGPVHNHDCRAKCHLCSVPTSQRPEGARNVAPLHTYPTSAGAPTPCSSSKLVVCRRDGVPQGGRSRSANHSRSSTLGKPLSVKPLSFHQRSRAVRRLTPGQVRHAGQKRTQRIQG